MKKICATALVGMSMVIAGCSEGTSGGPGATSPPSQKALVGQSDDTFSLDVPSLKLKQGERKILTVGIHRGENFSEDVLLHLEKMPKGVALADQKPVIKSSEEEMELVFVADLDAALGDFTVTVMGHPTTGAVATSELKMSVEMRDSAAEIESSTPEAARAKWNEYTAAMQKQYDHYAARWQDLKNSAASAEGQTKADLDAKTATAKIKLDEARIKLDDLNTASADRWEKVKEGVGLAFEDLKAIFD